MHDNEEEFRWADPELPPPNKNGLFPFIDASGDIPDSMTPERVRQIMMEALDRVVAEMFPGLVGDRGFVNTQHFATVTMVTDTNDEWRGMLYPVEKPK